MAEKLPRIRAKRGGNRTVMTKLMNEADGLLKAETSDKKRLKAIAASLDEKLNLVKTLDEEIIENCAVEEVEAEIEESDEINSRVIDLLLVINEATGLMDNNDGLSVVPTTNIDDTTPPGSQQSITPSGTSGTSTLASKNNVQLQSPGSAAYGGFHSFDVASTSHAENMQSSGNSGMGSHLHTNFGMNANSVAYQPRAKLPKLVLPKFRGEITQWQGFWDSFKRPYTPILI
ncbi:uncharacterized protein LOC111329893 [Stylophora pistillata]|uniref:uncharacterized protein LOC111329893 n=1 Tax=Stylophora pistillata TaxID=50429 RepID=UPI000C0400B5|nr:uncharacterized protein LOC111329893 [Stylophora pistillata]